LHYLHCWHVLLDRSFRLCFVRPGQLARRTEPSLQALRRGPLWRFAVRDDGWLLGALVRSPFCSCFVPLTIVRNASTAGSWCPAASTSVTQIPCGSASLFCVAGAANATSVPSNAYSTPEAAPASQRTGYLLCPVGYQCSNGLRTKCALGHYQDVIGAFGECKTCAKGVIARTRLADHCPLTSVLHTGRFGAALNLTSAACSGPAAPGFWTSDGATSAQQFSVRRCMRQTLFSPVLLVHSAALPVYSALVSRRSQLLSPPATIPLRRTSPRKVCAFRRDALTCADPRFPPQQLANRGARKPRSAPAV
jgi:hypothetical protein